MADSRTTLGADTTLEREWDELADRTGSAPFMRPGWFRAWCDSFAGKLETVTVRDGELKALAPLVVTGRRVAAPVNQESPGFSLLAADPEARTALALAILSPDRSHVSLLRVTTPDAGALDDAASRSGFRVVKEPMQRSPFIAIDRSWDEYAGSLSSKFRKDLRRRIRRLEEEGEMTIEVKDGTEGLDRLLDEAFAIEALGWKGTSGTAIQSDDSTTSFYRAIAHWAADRGWLRLWLLRLNGKAIAFCLDVDDGHGYYGLKVAHDPEHAKVSPGMILQDDTIKYSFDKQLERFEFLGTDEAFKLKWTKDCHDLVAWRGFSRGPRGSLAYFGRKVVRPLVHKLRS